MEAGTAVEVRQTVTGTSRRRCSVQYNAIYNTVQYNTVERKHKILWNRTSLRTSNRWNQKAVLNGRVFSLRLKAAYTGYTNDNSGICTLRRLPGIGELDPGSNYAVLSITRPSPRKVLDWMDPRIVSPETLMFVVDNFDGNDNCKWQNGKKKNLACAHDQRARVLVQRHARVSDSQ